MSATPLLLVHGALNGAWVWADSFAPFFTAQGYGVQSLTLPAHQLGFASRQRVRLSDAVQVVVQAIDACDSPPVLVGHSFGGLVCLLAVQQRPVKALALLSPIPADGMWRSLLALGRLSPVSLVKFLVVTVDGRVATLGSPPMGIYSKACDPAVTKKMSARLRGESLPMLVSTLWRQLPPKPAAPLHFFGAEGDYIIAPKEVRRIAAKYGAPVTIYPGMSHFFQAEPDWPVMAQDIVDWLVKVEA